MSYQEDLKNPLWVAKRLEILERDDYKCTKCGIERPVLRGLIKSFGILTLSLLERKGFRLQRRNENLSYDFLFFIIDDNEIINIKGNNLEHAEFIGDKSKPLDLDKLIFTLKHTENRYYKLICFYEDAINGSCLIDHNVHHRYYIKDHKPWEYPNDALVCLCLDCHKTTHEETIIPVYNYRNGTILYESEICDRCGGSGYLNKYHYYMNGVCFKCGGEGVIFDENRLVS